LPTPPMPRSWQPALWPRSATVRGSSVSTRIEEIRGRMIAGESKVQIAKAYGVSRRTLYSALAAHAITA
jgi:hypothetical protein